MKEVSSIQHFMEPLLPYISQDVYKELWEKAAELASFAKQYNNLKESRSKLKQELLLLQIHHAFRTPFGCKKSSRKLAAEMELAKNPPDIDTLKPLTDPVVFNFVKSVIDNRQTLIYRLSDDPRTRVKKEYGLFTFTQSPIDFFATYAIPPVFGFYSGTSNISDFIDAVGLAFDVNALRPEKFFANFPDSFLCSVLRRFFFSPHFNKYIFAHLTGVYHFFSCFKRKHIDQVSLFASFFTSFLNQMRDVVPGWPGFLRHIFQRISRKFEKNYQIVMLVVIYCILCPMMHNPKLYGVVPEACTLPPAPLNNFIQFCVGVSDIQTNPTTQSMYPTTLSSSPSTTSQSSLANIQNPVIHREKVRKDSIITPTVPPPRAVLLTGPSSLPTPNIQQQNIQFQQMQNEIEQLKIASEAFERGTIANLVAILLEPADITDCGPEFDESAAPAQAIFALSQYESDVAAKEAVQELLENNTPNTIFVFRVEMRRRGYTFQESLKLLTELLSSTNPFYIGDLQPNLAAIKNTLQNRYFEYERVISNINNEIQNCLEAICADRGEINELKTMIMDSNTSIHNAETTIATNIVQAMIDDNNVVSDVDRRRNAFRTDQTSVAQFVIWNLDTYLAQNSWIKPFMPLVSRIFHSYIVSEFDLKSYVESMKTKDMDDLFSAHKKDLIQKIQSSGVDERTKKILSDPKIFQAAASKLQIASTIDSPSDCTKLISEGLATAENLYTFVNGAVPEANQLMPILATLFVLTEMKSPISFGKWLAAHFKPLIEKRPDWFRDDEGARLEHFFQLNEWICGLLENITQ